MGSYPSGKQIFGLTLLLMASLASTSIAAEPKVKKASHQVTTDDAPRELKQADERELKQANENDLRYSPQWPEPPNTGAMLLRLVGGTVVVLGLSVVSIWLGKPWLQRFKVAGVGSPNFHIEGSVAVGNRAMLYLVKVGETQLIAGTDASGLKSLIAIPASFKEVLDTQIPEAPAPVAPPARPFDQRIIPRVGGKE